MSEIQNPVNLEQLKLATDNDLELEKEIIILYLDDTKKKLSILDSSLSTDIKAFSRTAHTIKGASLNMGANAVADLAKQLEFATKDGPTNEDLPGMVSKLKEAFEVTESFFTEHLKSL